MDHGGGREEICRMGKGWLASGPRTVSHGRRRGAGGEGVSAQMQFAVGWGRSLGRLFLPVKHEARRQAQGGERVMGSGGEEKESRREGGQRTRRVWPRPLEAASGAYSESRQLSSTGGGSPALPWASS